MQIGQRVIVYNGDKSKLLGEGTYEGTVTAYAIITPDGHLLSNGFAETEPEHIPPGGELLKLDDNPKLKLDDGSIHYGCQVWWSPISEIKAEDMPSDPFESFAV